MKKEVLDRFNWVQSAPNVFVKFVRAVKASWDTSSEFRAEVKKFKKDLRDSWIGRSSHKENVKLQDQPSKDIKEYN